jgi:hypothetical protein
MHYVLIYKQYTHLMWVSYVLIYKQYIHWCGCHMYLHTINTSTDVGVICTYTQSMGTIGGGWYMSTIITFHNGIRYSIHVPTDYVCTLIRDEWRTYVHYIFVLCYRIPIPHQSHSEVNYSIGASIDYVCALIHDEWHIILHYVCVVIPHECLSPRHA